MTTKIEWADETWNPVIGCSKISAGCENCYAEKMACRLAHMGKRAYQDVVDPLRDPAEMISGDTDNWFKKWNGKTSFIESALEKPLHWKKPRRVFVCSMGDLFHESFNYRGAAMRSIFRTMAMANTHTFIILTKRPERMQRCIDFLYGPDFAEEMPHVWLGVTAENQETADHRIPVLLQIPAAVRFVSVEPMLGPVDLRSIRYDHLVDIDSLTGDHGVFRPLQGRSQDKLDWVICGGETGPGARPMHPDWVRSLLDQCYTAQTPFFFKRWGEWARWEDPDCNYMFDFNRDEMDAKHKRTVFCGRMFYRIGKKRAGRILDGLHYDEFPANDSITS